MDTHPTSDQVAQIIAAACRETGASPLDVLAGKFDDDYRNPSYAEGYPISRARVYAAAAINEMFDCGRAASSRMCGVGSKSQAAHLSVVYSGSAKWFDVEVLRRVASVIDPQRGHDIEFDREYPRRKVILASSVEQHNEVREFKVGDIVFHPSYGPGLLVEVGRLNPRRRDYPLQIKFENSGHEQVMYARTIKSAQALRPSPVFTQEEVKSRLPTVYSL